MTPNEVKWVQGYVVVSALGPYKPEHDYEKDFVRATDYVLLQMMGKIKHCSQLLPAVPKTLPTLPTWPNSNWPFKG